MAGKYPDDDVSIRYQRFTDVQYEKNEFLLPIDGYQKVDLLPLETTMKPIEKFIDPNIQDKVYIAKNRSKNPKDGLSQEESAAIQIYTMESSGYKKSLYYNLNKTLREENRHELVPYFAYLKLLLTALWKLPSFSGRAWRGVNSDIPKDFQVGEKLVWWGFSSCTRSLSVLESPKFLGKEGTRTLFSIECSNGKVIRNHSYYSKEDEVLLLPGIELLVIGKVKPALGLTIIELKEIIDSPVILLKPPFAPSTIPEYPSVVEVTTNFDTTLNADTPLCPFPAVIESNEMSTEVKELIQRLKSNTATRKDRYLAIKFENLSTDDGKAIVEALKVNSNVTTLSLQSKNMSDECLEYIIDSLKTNTHISCLCFYGDEKANFLVSIPTYTLVEVLKVNKMIKTLEIKCTTVTDADIKIITDALQKSTTVERFYCRNNPYLTLQSAHDFGQLIKTSKTLSYLQLSGQPNIDDDYATVIASAMNGNQSVKMLDMDHSQIGDGGARAFGEMLAINKTLESFDLSNNQITSAGAVALANGLRQNTMLGELFVGGNRFKRIGEGGRALLKLQSETLEIDFAYPSKRN